MTDPQNPSSPPPYGSAQPAGTPGVPPAPAPGNAVPPVPPAPGFASPQAPASAPQQTPPGAYTAPVGGYPAAQGAYTPPVDTAKRSPLFGILAGILGLVAAVVSPIIGGIAGYQAGYRFPDIIDGFEVSTENLAVLSPVRDQVLLGEIGFWIGTLTGIAAIVFGIVSIVKRSGRGWGITGLVLGVVGAGIFFVVLSVLLGFGSAAGAVAFYS